MEFRPGRNVIQNNRLVIRGGQPVIIPPKTPEKIDCKTKKLYGG